MNVYQYMALRHHLTEKVMDGGGHIGVGAAHRPKRFTSLPNIGNMPVHQLNTE